MGSRVDGKCILVAVLGMALLGFFFWTRQNAKNEEKYQLYSEVIGNKHL